MSEEAMAGTEAVEPPLRDIEEAKQALIDACAQVSDEEFTWAPPQGHSIRATLEKAADEVSFFYATLIARARGRPPLPCMQSADFLSIREAVIALQVVHRRFSNLLHDLRPQDLARTAQAESGATVSLRQALEMAAQHYRSQAAQVQRLRAAFQEARS